MEGRIAIGPDSCNLNRRDLSVLGGRPHTTPWLGSTRFAPRQPCDVSHAVTFTCHEYGLSNIAMRSRFAITGGRNPLGNGLAHKAFPKPFRLVCRSQFTIVWPRHSPRPWPGGHYGRT